ncbi:hypothetical protein FNV43_RR19917 [Rhamnella rubrinervis]|uniref:Uncharacterized protein n=1 Tax=Rhamnella rubrinervis TaxID=2594499 RepID=A0A8K0E051_9ROSA|nr:hypothetical protein FNV43_RR19917 [Rhamnella rubrinervis]
MAVKLGMVMKLAVLALHLDAVSATARSLDLFDVLASNNPEAFKLSALMLEIIAFQNAKPLLLLQLKRLKSHPQSKPTSCVWVLSAGAGIANSLPIFKTVRSGRRLILAAAVREPDCCRSRGSAFHLRRASFAGCSGFGFTDFVYELVMVMAGLGTPVGGTLPSSHSNSSACGIENTYAVNHSMLGIKVTEGSAPAAPTDISELPTEHVNEKAPAAPSLAAVVSENARGMSAPQTNDGLSFSAVVRMTSIT